MSHHQHHAHEHGDDDWDDKADWYDEVVDLLEPELSKATQALLDAVDVRLGLRLLDLACGPGHTTAAAQAAGAAALGIDLSPKMVDAARRRFPDARFQVGDALTPPAGPWDAIVCRLGAHHLPDGWAQAAARVLAPGGRLAIAEFDGDHETRHENGMRGPDYWTTLLASAGFTDIQVTSRHLRLGSLVANEPRLSDLAGDDGPHFEDGPLYIVSGRRSDG